MEEVRRVIARRLALKRSVSTPRRFRNDTHLKSVAISGDPLPATEDLVARVAAVAPLRPTEQLFDLYVRGDDVAGKVKPLKRHGELVTRTAVRRPVWPARIAYCQIV